MGQARQVSCDAAQSKWGEGGQEGGERARDGVRGDRWGFLVAGKAGMRRGGCVLAALDRRRRLGPGRGKKNRQCFKTIRPLPLSDRGIVLVGTVLTEFVSIRKEALIEVIVRGSDM